MSTLSNDQIRDFIKQGESDRVELVRNISRPDILARFISAFANTKGGYILVGVDESGGISGVESQKMIRLYDAAQKRLRNASSSSIHFQHYGEVEIAVISIAKSPRLVSSDDGVFVRNGERTVAMPEQDIAAAVSTQNQSTAIEDLISAVSKQTRTIEELKHELQKAGSWQSKAKDYLIGGLIGAVLGAIVGVIVAKL